MTSLMETNTVDHSFSQLDYIMKLCYYRFQAENLFESVIFPLRKGSWAAGTSVLYLVIHLSRQDQNLSYFFHFGIFIFIVVYL